MFISFDFWCRSIFKENFLKTPFLSYFSAGLCVSSVSTASTEEQVEVEVADGYTMTQFCDKMIEVFLNEKPKPKDWRKYLVFRDEWKKYRDRFYGRCSARADAENDTVVKNKLISLASKIKKVAFFLLLLSFFFFFFNWEFCAAVFRDVLVIRLPIKVEYVLGLEHDQE